MAFSASFIATSTIRDALKNAIALNFGGTSPDTIKLALFDNNISPSADTDPLAYGSAPWNAHEVSGTGWSSGGVSLSSPTCTIPGDGTLKLDAADVSEDDTTLTSARGCLIYDSSISSKGLIAVTFGADYSTIDGTFAITFDSSGIAVVDLTP